MDYKGFIAKRLKLAMARYMLITAAVAAITVCCGYFARDYILSVVRGTPSISSISEAQAYYEAGTRYVTVAADEITPVDYMVDASGNQVAADSSKAVASFWLIYQESNFFFIKLPIAYYDDMDSKTEDVMFKGMLREERGNVKILSVWSEVLTESYEASAEDLKKDLVGNLYLDATLNEDLIFIGGVLYLLLLLCETAVFLWHLLRFINPGLHGIYNRFAAYGDKDVIERLIEEEMETGCYVKTSGDFVMRTFTLCTSRSIGIYRTSDLVWVYGFGKKGRDVRLNFEDEKNQLTMRADSGQQRDEIIADIAAAIPVIVGYSKETERLYNNDRTGFTDLWGKTRDAFVNKGSTSEPDEETAGLDGE